MKTIVIATGNAHKVEEFNRLANAWSLPNLRFVSAKDVLPEGMPPVIEDAGTFQGNARLKAQALRDRAPAEFFVLADDSGLCVDALDGAPGVETAYYAGEHATAKDHRQKLLATLANIPTEKRGAHFLCLLLLISPQNETFIFEGECQGRIAEKEAGNEGFGYDPIFTPCGFSQTFSEIDGKTKDRLSHRGMAFAKLAKFFSEQ